MMNRNTIFFICIYQTGKVKTDRDSTFMVSMFLSFTDFHIINRTLMLFLSHLSDFKQWKPSYFREKSVQPVICT